MNDAAVIPIFEFIAKNMTINIPNNNKNFWKLAKCFFVYKINALNLCKFMQLIKLFSFYAATADASYTSSLSLIFFLIRQKVSLEETIQQKMYLYHLQHVKMKSTEFHIIEMYALAAVKRCRSN